MLQVEYRCDVGRAAFASASKSPTPILDERDESALTTSGPDGNCGPWRQRRQPRRRDSILGSDDRVVGRIGEAATGDRQRRARVVADRVFVVSGGKRFLRTRRSGANGCAAASVDTASNELPTDSSEPPGDSAAAPERPPLVFVELTDVAVAEWLGSPRHLLPPRITPAFDPTDALPFPFRTNLSRQNTMRTYHEQEEYYRRRRAWIQLQEEKAAAVALSEKTLVASLWAGDDDDDDSDAAPAATTADPVHHEFVEACWRPDGGGDGDEKTTPDLDERRESKVERRPSPSVRKSPLNGGWRGQMAAHVAETRYESTTTSGRRAPTPRKSATKPEARSRLSAVAPKAATAATRTQSLISTYRESGATLVGAEPRLHDMKNAVILVERRPTESPPKPAAADVATLLARFVPRCVGTPRVMRAVVDCVDSHVIERAHPESVFLVAAGPWAGLLVCIHSLCFRYRTLPSLVASAYRLPEYAGADEIRDHDARNSESGGGGGGGGDAHWRTNRALMEHLRRHNAVEAYERESFDPELVELYPHLLSSSCARNHAIRCALTGVCVRCEVVGVVSGARYYAKPYYADSERPSVSSSTSSFDSFATPSFDALSASSSPLGAPSSASMPSPTLVEDACVVVDLQHLSLYLGADVLGHAFSASPSSFSDEYRPRPLPPYLDAYDFSD